MESKPLLYGLIGFFIGGLIVSVATTTSDKSKHQDDSSMSHMTQSLKGKTGDDFDKAFLKAMTIHHQGAIDMAKLADKQAAHQEVKDLSEAILSAQKDEITKMKAWQTDWGYDVTKTPAASSSMH